MKKILLLIIATVVISCSIKPETPGLTKNEIYFEKKGGEQTIHGTNAVFFVYDKKLGYKESDKYSNGGLESQTLDCEWIIFEIITIYDGDYHYTDPKVTITVQPNTTGENRIFSMKFNNILNGKESRTTTLTVHQKGE